MIIAALLLFGTYFGVAFVVRAWIQWRRTGDSGFRGRSGRIGSAAWWTGVLFAAAIVAGLLGPVTALAGLEPVGVLTAPVVQAAGVTVAVLGIVATFVTQLEMGASWRIGVESTETTELVTTGAFAWVRNPIFSAMAVTGLGLALMVPNIVALFGMALLVIALQLQVRVVEEPYLRRAHGEAYARYAASTARFIPGLGTPNTHGSSLTGAD